MSTIQFLQTTPEQLSDLITESVKKQLQDFKTDLSKQQASEDLLTRDQACKFLKINSSTLWAWTNKGKVIAYGISNRRYYKRSELLECLTQLKK